MKKRAWSFIYKVCMGISKLHVEEFYVLQIISLIHMHLHYSTRRDRFFSSSLTCQVITLKDYFAIHICTSITGGTHLDAQFLAMKDNDDSLAPKVKQKELMFHDRNARQLGNILSHF